MGEFVTKEEFEALARRVQLLERAEARIVGEPIDIDDQIARAVAAAPPVPPEAPEEKLVPLADVVEVCPKHPDAPQTKNGCTADGCTFPG